MRAPDPTFIDVALSDGVMLAKLLGASLLCSTIGWEREKRERPAGLRTHMLVGLSACAFVMIGELLIHQFSGIEPGGFRYDPIRIVEATVAGVSFLGAGSVFVQRNKVRGLTTAGSLLASAAVGIMVALEHYVLATGTTILLAVIIGVLGYVTGSNGGGD